MAVAGGRLRELPPVRCPLRRPARPRPDYSSTDREGIRRRDPIFPLRTAGPRKVCPRRLAVPPITRRTSATVAGIDAVVTKVKPEPSAAAYAPLLSLMHIFGTTLEAIPTDTPYLRVDPARATRFQERVGVAAGLKVGLVWAGDPDRQERHEAIAGVVRVFSSSGAQRN